VVDDEVIGAIGASFDTPEHECRSRKPELRRSRPCEWMQAGRSTKGDHVPRQTLRYVPCSATMLVFGAVRWN
jgi:hypothetical protein